MDNALHCPSLHNARHKGEPRFDEKTPNLSTDMDLHLSGRIGHIGFSHPYPNEAPIVRRGLPKEGPWAEISLWPKNEILGLDDGGIFDRKMIQK